MEGCCEGGRSSTPRSLDDDDRAASAQFCKGAAFQHHVPSKRQRRSRGLATGDRDEDENTLCRTIDVHPVLPTSRWIARITAWEREIATYERDSGKILDDEIKIGTGLLRLPESQLKTHLLMRVDKLKK